MYDRDGYTICVLVPIVGFSSKNSINIIIDPAEISPINLIILKNKVESISIFPPYINRTIYI